MASIEEAKDIIKSTPISSIVNFYHPISKKGANYEGICPFHGDSHPSLKINDSKGIYKCFACGAAGDSIKFVQDKLSLDFVDAIKDIASNLGIDIEEKQKGPKNPKYDMALRVLQAASKLYKKIGQDLNPKHFQDFLKNRKLNEESLQNFQLGYAPGNNALLSYLQSIPESDQKMAMQVASELGLIRPSKNGHGHYDFYRDRIMFPIWDHGGKVRGYSSRAVLPDQVPKYLNSGESFIFDKKNILYGFNLAKKAIREEDSVLIVEGNMDVIMLHQYGFKNSIATMGVALSTSAGRLLSNMTQNIYLAMDSDPAGIKAMTRINEDFLSFGISPKYIDFSPAKDPDEFLNEFGRLELCKRIEEAPSFLDFLIKSTIPEQIPESTEKKLEILQQVFKIVAPLEASLLAIEKVTQCAKSLSLRSSNEDIQNEYKKFLKKDNKTHKKFEHKQLAHPAAQPMDPFPPQENQELPPPHLRGEQEIATKPVSKVEQLLLESLLTHPECVLNDQMTEILDKIQHFEVKRIVQWLKKIYLEIDETEYALFVKDKMEESLPGDVKQILATSLFSFKNLKLDKKVIDKMLFDFIKKLDEQELKKQRNELRQKQLQATTDEEGLEILAKIQKIEQTLLDIRNK